LKPATVNSSRGDGVAVGGKDGLGEAIVLAEEAAALVVLLDAEARLARRYR
jgi:hypothetical protein